MPCQGICWETNCRNNHNFGRNFHNNNYGQLRTITAIRFKKTDRSRLLVSENNEKELE